MISCLDHLASLLFQPLFLLFEFIISFNSADSYFKTAIPLLTSFLPGHGMFGVVFPISDGLQILPVGHGDTKVFPGMLHSQESRLFFSDMPILDETVNANRL